MSSVHTCETLVFTLLSHVYHIYGAFVTHYGLGAITYVVLNGWDFVSCDMLSVGL